ncbi:MAG: DUF1573 domain-containing protein [Bacteroidales bacterium]
MKTIFLHIPFIFIALLMFSCSQDSGRIPTDVVNNPQSASGDQSALLPVIAFEKDHHDFGRLIQGEKVTIGFKFRNTGKADLVISQVNSGCGCTVPNFPKEPIKPGESGFIQVSFDSAGRRGVQNQAVTVVSNCQPNQTILRIKAMIITP